MQAEAALRAALACRPDFPEAHRRPGGLLQQTGRHDEADAHFRHAAALDPRAGTAGHPPDGAGEE